MTDDYLENLFDRFVIERQRSVQGLFSKFSGIHRAKIVETNDPINKRRVRIKIPEMHSYDLADDKCPWAIVSPWAGGKQCGSFNSYSIGDIVFVAFESNHPYSPIVIAAADPTRRANYPLESIYSASPSSLTELGEVSETPIDYEVDWLPKDKRPMSEGLKDRYGNCFIMNAVGFFPKEHEAQPTDPGADPVSKNKFQKGSPPKENDPDTKYIALFSKYGNLILLSDVGYNWKKEFDGDWDKDKEKERTRSKYYTKHFTEQASKDRDQRRIEFRTRCGHVYEMRDVGWKTSRANDPWGASNTVNVGSQSGFDERWVKIRTKGGHLIQLMDSGFDEKSDNMYKALNKDQFGGKVDSEESFWQNQDARQIRFITRHGFKFVLDDRGSDKSKAEENDVPHGNGIILKGKRKAGGQNRGFGIEFNEKDEMNKMVFYTPRSKCFEMNDKHNYIILCTDTRKPLSEEWQSKKDNEFAKTPVRSYNPEQDTCCLTLDNNNEYVRLKTPSQQGIEFRDGGQPCGFTCDDDPNEGSGGASRDGFQGQRLFNTGNTDECKHKTWGAMEDKDKRAFFMTHDEKAIVIHSSECGSCIKPIPAMWLIMDEKGEGSAGIWTKHTEPNTLIIQNLCNKIKVYAVNDIEFYTKKNFRIKAEENIEIRSLKDIIWRADGDILGSSDKMTHHWAGTDYKVKAKQNINEHALQRITNLAGTSHCIVADVQATVWSKGAPHVTQGPGAAWVVGPGIVGTESVIHAPEIDAVVGPGPQAHVMYGSSSGDHPVGAASSNSGSACPADQIPNETRIQASDNQYQKPTDDRFRVCGRKKTGNGPFTPAPLGSIRGNPGSPKGGGGEYSGGSVDTPEPPPPPPPPAPPPPPPPPEGTITCYQAIGYTTNTGDYSDWELSREECDKAPITTGGFGGLQVSQIIMVVRGGCSINTGGVDTLQIDILNQKQSSSDIMFNVLYSYLEPTIGADFNSWYSIAEISSKTEHYRIDVTKLIGGALGGRIYFAAVAKSDRFTKNWPKIIKDVADEHWFSQPTYRFVINSKPTGGE